MKKIYVAGTCLLLAFFSFLAVGCGEKSRKADHEARETNLPGMGEPVPEKGGREGEAVEGEILEIEPEDGREVDLADYSSYMGRVWYAKEGDPADNKIPVSLVITRIEEGYIEGKMAFDRITGYPTVPVEPDFRGIIYDGTAECKYYCPSYGRQGTVFLTFTGEDRMEAEMDGDKGQCYLLRPYSLSDENLYDVSISEVDLEAWGTVNLVSGSYDGLHPCPCFYITNGRNDILYDEDDSCGINGWDVWDIFLEDINNDGMQDLVAVTCAGDEPDGGRYVRIFYQHAQGAFLKGRVDLEKMPDRYYGNYRISQFCPTEDYAQYAGEWLTQQEADSMLGRTVEIKEDIMVTYDSERRRGTRVDRPAPRSNNEILEYQTGSIDYWWKELTPEMLQNCSVTGDVMKEAVGEEYYGKINGVFIGDLAAIQWFFTLEGEDSLIMYSLLSKQYFILEREG